MSNTKFLRNLKPKLDELKEHTLFSLLAKDKEYLEISTQLNRAVEKYRQLKLPEPQKSIIDDYLSINDSCNMEHSTLSYLAGLIDGQKLGTLIPSTSTETNNNTETIRKFYYGILQPCAEPCESSETREFWKKLIEEGNLFSDTLTPEQSVTYKQLVNKETEGVGYSMADSFIYGFQLSAKILMTLLD